MDSNPELDALYADLKSKVDALVKDFWSKLNAELTKAASSNTAAAAASGPAQGQPYSVAGKSLPWFQHGVRGFLRKIWYGDHPENPSWNRLQQPNESIRKVSLGEYSIIRSEMTALLEDVAPGGIGTEFMNSLMGLIMHYMQQAHKLGFERSSAPANSTADPASAITPPEYINPAGRTKLPSTASWAEDPNAPPAPAKPKRTRKVGAAGGSPMPGSPQDNPVTATTTAAPAKKAAKGAEWLWNNNDNVEGPFTWAQMKKLAVQGKISDDSHVRRESDPQWYLASATPGLIPAAPKDTSAAAEVNHESIANALPKFLVAKTSNDKAGQEAALKEAGIRFTDKGLKDEGSIKIMVYLMKKLCEDGDFDLSDIDWIAPNSYKDIFHKLPTNQNLLKVIHKVRAEVKGSEMQTNAGKDMSRASTPAVDPLESNLSNRVDRYKKMLREGSGHFETYNKMKSLPLKEKVKFLKENLTVAGV